MLQLIRADQVRLTANGPGIKGQRGVVYQVDELLGRLYYWDGEKHVPLPTAAEAAATQALVADAGNLRRQADVALLDDFAAFVSTQSAVSTTAAVALTPTAVARAARLAWVDLKRPTGATTDGAAYAVGTKTINLASAGTGALYAGDVITFAGQSNEYALLSADGDVSNGGSITLAGYGLFVAISAAAAAITLVRRGARLRVAVNCDNDVEGLLCSQDERSRDCEVTLGEAVMLRSDATITQLHASANVSVLANNHRIEVVYGV